jgi:hypothetical protein
MKFCKDCKHHRSFWLKWDGSLDGCRAESATSLITGKTVSVKGFADVNRRHESCCGESAKWFAPKKTIWMRLAGQVT